MSNIRPVDFDQYWKETLDELSGTPANPEVELIPIRCTDYATMYGVRLTSIGPYRLFGYLSIPAGEGPFPAIYYTSKYQSVVEPIPQGTANLQRGRYITFSCGARGQRNVDEPYAAKFPGQLTEKIDDSATYIFRGIAADCVRGLEYLLSRTEVDRDRIVAVGNDMALITAALARGVTHVISTPALFLDTCELASKTGAYPLEEINDYLRAFPDREAAVRETLAHLDLRWFAPQVDANTLIMAGAPGSLLSGSALESVRSGISGEAEIHDSESSSYRDGLFVEEWIARKFGYAEAIVPEGWR
ncbi:MAG: acetylxylan esterase [Chloroflexi bacterium]|nr:acetylxylan esterase [Chloroflexota bacterium]